MVVYHFLPADHAVQSLLKQRLTVSLLTDLNDPFELLSNELTTRQARQAFATFRTELAGTYGVLCFSRTWSNPVLWSHYSDRHKGICLGFDIPNRAITPVTYTGKRLQLKIEKQLKKGRLTETTRQQLLSTKFADWKYENEVRVFVNLSEADRDDSTRLFFNRYGDDLRLREVILGMRCTYSGREISGLLLDDVKIRRARLAFRTFRVVTNKLATKRQR